MSLEKPNYNDSKDRELYEQLWNKERTEEEDRFFKTMFHQEEFACDLEG